MKEEIICKDMLEHCICTEAKGHKGLHKCRCGGSWDEKKIPHSFPDISRGLGAFPLLGIEDFFDFLIKERDE